MKGSAGGPVLALHLAVIVLLLALQFVLPPFQQSMLARIMVFATYAIGYNVLLGYTGLMSLGHAMFFGSGMYATGLAVYYLGAGPAAGFALGLVASLAVSTIIGGITLRTSGVSFLIATMMFAQVAYVTTLYFNRVTGGDQGLVLTGRLHSLGLGGLHFALTNPAARYNVALAVFAVAFLLSLWLARSPIGRVLIAVRENEDRTRLLGYNTTAYKLFALIVSGGIAGMAGATYTLLFSYLGSSFASILYSIYPLLWTLLGGVGTTIGPLIGTALMTYIIDIASALTDSYLVVVGLALVLIIMRLPAGVVGGVRSRWPGWVP
jgi:branched-chain amino acid transport system permease protein